MIKNKPVAILALCLFVTLAVSSVTAQNGGPFLGEHEYQGTQEDSLSGSLSGTFTQDETQIKVREYTINSAITHDTATIQKDLSPLPLTGTVNQGLSSTILEWSAQAGFQGTTTSFFNGTINISGKNCSNGGWSIQSGGSSLEPSRGHGFHSGILICDYSPSPNQDIIINFINAVQTLNPRIDIKIIHQEVYETRLIGDITGTFTGTSSGTHQGEIEQIPDMRNATFGNITTNNLTVNNRANTGVLSFENLLGSLSFDIDDTLLFLIFAIFLLIVAEWRKDAMFYLLSTLGFTFYIFITADRIFELDLWRLLLVSVALYSTARAVMMYPYFMELLHRRKEDS